MSNFFPELWLNWQYTTNRQENNGRKVLSCSSQLKARSCNITSGGTTARPQFRRLKSSLVVNRRRLMPKLQFVTTPGQQFPRFRNDCDRNMRRCAPCLETVSGAVLRAYGSLNTKQIPQSWTSNQASPCIRMGGANVHSIVYITQGWACRVFMYS